jgi:hypothetical protein
MGHGVVNGTWRRTNAREDDANVLRGHLVLSLVRRHIRADVYHVT